MATTKLEQDHAAGLHADDVYDGCEACLTLEDRHALGRHGGNVQTHEPVPGCVTCVDDIALSKKARAEIAAEDALLEDMERYAAATFTVNDKRVK